MDGLEAGAPKRMVGAERNDPSPLFPHAPEALVNAAANLEH